MQQLQLTLKALQVRVQNVGCCCENEAETAHDVECVPAKLVGEALHC